MPPGLVIYGILKGVPTNPEVKVYFFRPSKIRKLQGPGHAIGLVSYGNLNGLRRALGDGARSWGDGKRIGSLHYS